MNFILKCSGHSLSSYYCVKTGMYSFLYFFIEVALLILKVDRELHSRMVQVKINLHIRVVFSTCIPLLVYKKSRS